MSRTFIACLLFFVISSVTVFSENEIFHWQTRTGFSLYITDKTGLDYKAQPAETLQTGFLFAIGDYIAINTTVGMFFVQSSDAKGGFSYRGFQDLLIRTDLQGRLPLHRGENSFYLGLSIGPEIHYAHYLFTNIQFFYPALFGEPFFDIVFSEKKQITLRISLPVRFQFRIDTNLSMSAGLGISFLFRPLYL